MYKIYLECSEKLIYFSLCSPRFHYYLLRNQSHTFIKSYVFISRFLPPIYTTNNKKSLGQKLSSALAVKASHSSACTTHQQDQQTILLQLEV